MSPFAVCVTTRKRDRVRLTEQLAQLVDDRIDVVGERSDGDGDVELADDFSGGRAAVDAFPVRELPRARIFASVGCTGTRRVTSVFVRPQAGVPQARPSRRACGIAARRPARPWPPAIADLTTRRGEFASNWSPRRVPRRTAQRAVARGASQCRPSSCGSLVPPHPIANALRSRLPSSSRKRRDAARR